MTLAPAYQQSGSVKQANFFSKYQPIVGTPEELAVQIQDYADLGISHFCLRYADYPKTAGLKLFIQDVLPRFGQVH